MEDFNKWNVYIPVVFDLTCSPITRSSYYSFFGNYESIVQPAVAVANVTAHTAVAGTTQAQIDAAITSLETNIDTLINNTVIPMDRVYPYYPRLGAAINIADVAAGAASTVKVYGFILPSILGSFSKKLFRVSEIAGANLNIDLQTDTIANALVSDQTPTSITLSRMRLNLSVVEYNATITEVVRRAYNHTYVIPCISIQKYSTLFTTSSTGNFTWNINASLKNAKGMLFVFRDATSQAQYYFSLTNRTSLGMLQAQLAVGTSTFPENRYLLYDCST